MKDENKTKAQLLDELMELRQCVTNWEALKTNHERAKEALRESEARYSALIENIPVGLYRNTPGPKGRFIMANPAVWRMFGYDNLEEFLQTPVADLYWNPAERRLFSERLLAQEHVIAEEVQLKKRDGTVIWGAITASAIRDESGEVKYFDGMIQDITERKRAEQAQLQGKATVRALLDAPTDSAILLDSSGTVLAINETGAQNLGKSVEELVGKYIFDFLPPGVAESRRPLVLKASESGRPIRFEDERGGRFYDHNVYPVTDAQGRVVQVAIYTRDITDFKRAEARVRERTAELIDSEEKYRTMVENVPLVVYRIRPSGEILFVNQFVEEVFGYSTTEIFRNPNLWNEKVYDEDRARVEKLLGKSFVDGKEFVAEYRVKHKNGHIVYVVDHAIPFYSTEGLISSVDGIIMDVTHRVKLQEKLVRAEGLKTISEVSARLAHEIRNPLVSAGGFARRLLSSLGADDPNRAKVEIIVKEVGRLETILRMMLNYIQPIELEKSRTDLNQLIERALSEVGMEIKEKNANVNLTLTPGLPEISVDRPQMELALETLAKQALNLMREGEKLSISTFQENEMLKVVMRCPVQHMSADDVEHFFYPFATSRFSYNTADLPMSKTLVDKHGGVIDVNLAQSGELIIHISLPL
jgi:PAS domain S-box-containing protein